MEPVTAPVGLAVVGAGYWGPNLVRNSMATASIDLRWLCDLDVERARGVLGPYSTIAATDSFDTVLDDPVGARRRHRHPGGHARPARAGGAGRRQARAGREAADARRSTTAQKLVAGGRGPRAGPDVRPHLLLHAGGAGATRAGRTAASSATSSSSTRSGSTSAWCSRDVDVLWDLAPHDLSILDFMLPDGVARRTRWPRTAPTRSGTAGLRGLPDAAAVERRDRARPRQLAVPDQDPHDGHRRLAADAGLGRPEPQPAAVGLRPRRRPQAPEELDADDRKQVRSPTARATWSRRRCASRRRCGVMVAEFARRDHRAPAGALPTAAPGCAS